MTKPKKIVPIKKEEIRKMKIAIAQTNPLIGDLDGNAEKIIKACKKAREEKVELIAFPELSICGYPPFDLVRHKSFVKKNKEIRDYLLREIKDIALIFGYISEGENNKVRNSAVFAKNGEILCHTDKKNLSEDDFFNEKKYFQERTDNSEGAVYKGFKIKIKLGRDIEDLNKKEREELKSALIFNLAAPVFEISSTGKRAEYLSDLSRKYRLNLIEVNQTGANDSLIFQGSSSAYGVEGELMARAEAFKEDMVFLDIKDKRGDIRELPEKSIDFIEAALICGISDYLKKSGISKIVAGSSGGIDSALLLTLASRAIGAENIISLYMPGPYTGKENLEDTRKLAKNLGIGLDILPIDKSMETLFAACPVFDKEAHGATEQNLQARIRGLFLMAYANKYQAMALPSSNKAEMAIGYTTLYGDMNGGLFALGDLSKERIWELSRRINEKAGREIIPESIIDKSPSAELKPEQKDEDELPPYKVLDAVIARYIEEEKEAEEIIKEGYDRELVYEIIRKIRINEHKRRQAAPILRISKKSFGKERHYPLAAYI